MKKLQLIMLVCIAAIAAARAQEAAPVKLGDVTLTDGRAYKAVVFVSESPMRITVRHAGGLAQLEKKKLPEPLRAQYPADEAAAERQRIAEQERRAAAAAEYERTRPEREEKARLFKEQRMASVAFREAEERREAQARAQAYDSMKKRVQSEADDYFRTTWRPGLTAVIVTDYRAKIEELAEKPGWPGQWSFSGEGYVEYYVSKGGSFSSNRVRFSGEVDAQGRITITSR